MGVFANFTGFPNAEVLAWETSDTLSVLAIAASLVALGVALWQWYIDRSERAAERRVDRVWANVVDLLIVKDGGLRTVSALDDRDRDGRLRERLTALRRTRIQLEAVGEEALADRLGALVSLWDVEPDPNTTDPKDRARLEFYQAVRQRLDAVERRR
jgi:hypothetical protein